MRLYYLRACYYYVFPEKRLSNKKEIILDWYGLADVCFGAEVMLRLRESRRSLEEKMMVKQYLYAYSLK